MEELYKNKSIRITFFNAESKDVIITFNYLEKDFDPIIPKEDGDYAWGNGIYCKKLGINEINVTSTCMNYFHTKELETLVEVIKRKLPKNANVLCIGQSMGGHGAMLFASHLCCDFYAFSPQFNNVNYYTKDKFKRCLGSDEYTKEQKEEICEIIKSIENFNMAINLQYDFKDSLLVYDQYSLDNGIYFDLEEATKAVNFFKCKILRCPFATHSAITYINQTYGLTNLVKDYFKGQKFINKLIELPLNKNKQRTKKVAVCCSSNAVLKDGFMHYLKEAEDEKCEFKQFSLGDTCSINPIVTCLENNIPDIYDVCLVDNILNDIIFLERFEITEELILGAIYCLISLFHKKKCKLVFLLHSPVHHVNPYLEYQVKKVLNRFADSITVIDYSVSRVFAFSKTNYIDLSHYNKNLQYQLAKHIKLVISDSDSLANVNLKDFILPNFKLLTHCQKFASNFNIPKNTSLVNTKCWILKQNDRFTITIDDLGFNSDCNYIYCIKYWNTDKTNSLSINSDNQNKKTFLVKKKFIDKLSNSNVTFKFNSNITFSIAEFEEKQSNEKVHNFMLANVPLEQSELVLVNMLFCDTNLEKIGAYLISNTGIRTCFEDYKAILFNYAKTKDFHCFNIYDSYYFIRDFLLKLQTNLEKIAFLDYCLFNSESCRSEII